MYSKLALQVYQLNVEEMCFECQFGVQFGSVLLLNLAQNSKLASGSVPPRPVVAIQRFHQAPPCSGQTLRSSFHGTCHRTCL